MKPPGSSTRKGVRGVSLALWAGELISAVHPAVCRALEISWGSLVKPLEWAELWGGCLTALLVVHLPNGAPCCSSGGLSRPCVYLPAPQLQCSDVNSSIGKVCCGP